MNDASIVQPYDQKSFKKMAQGSKASFNLPPPKLPPPNIPPQSSNWFGSLFGCCKPEVPPDFQDCLICNRRTFRNLPNKIKEEDKPYMSEARMKARQKQPIVIYYDRLTR